MNFRELLYNHYQKLPIPLNFRKNTYATQNTIMPFENKIFKVFSKNSLDQHRNCLAYM